MASLSTDKRGNRRILFVDSHGDRKAIRLGKIAKRAAEAIKYRVEILAAAQRSGLAVDGDTASWLAGIGDDLADKLARAGLIAPRDTKPAATLGAFIDSYIAGRNITKTNTLRNYNTTRRHLLNYFGPQRELATITPGDADEFQQHLQAHMADATASREVKRARQFFRAAVRKRLIAENPFDGLRTPQQVNDSREHFITREDTQAVLGACPDAQWRLIVALSRYGGLRCPSEHLALTWGDIDWERDRLTVRSPKTEHHRGGESRVIPLFPELRPHLEAAFDAAEPGTQHVVTRYRDSRTNLRTQLLRIIRRAGLQPWPKLFHNMRASRETELAAEHPLHVVCQWIGNSTTIAAKHYLQVTEADYEKAAQNAAQYMHARDRRDSQAADPAHEKTPVLQGLASDCDYLPNRQVPPRGVEPLSSD